MPRRPKTIPGPSRLSGLLKQLTRAPRLVLSEDVTRLKLTYRFKGGDLAARYVPFAAPCSCHFAGRFPCPRVATALLNFWTWPLRAQEGIGRRLNADPIPSTDTS